MIGATLAHYKIREKLGAGGMGEVYRAEDTTLGREVAIKVLPEAFTSDPERLARFEREARLLAALDHPNIASIHSFESADDLHFLVMQLAEGETLAERIARGPMRRDDALLIALKIAGALEAAHERGIIHRDLKPGNVKVDDQGRVKVLDFGLAKALDPTPETSPSPTPLSESPTLTAQMTTPGVLLGTAAYMSPEQARGEPADRRADIWAFGVVLWEMLTGTTLYADKTVSDTLAGVLKEEPDWGALPEKTPRSVRRLLVRCLEKEASERLQAIGEARIAIGRYLTEPETEEAADTPQRRVQPAWKGVLPWAVAGVLAPALGAAGEMSLFRGYGCSAVLSPDGSRVAYVSGDLSATKLYIHSLDQWKGALVAEGSGRAEPYHPFFSPDGQWLGFVTRTELKKVPVAGGSPITLCEVNLNRGASWGPDGYIVLAPNRESGLYRVPAAGGEPEPLTTLDKDKGEVTPYNSNESGRFEVYVRPVFGRRGKWQVSAGGGGRPVWSGTDASCFI